MHEQNKTLIRENSIASDRHQLEIDRTLLNADREAKGGLAGIVSELSENTELVKLAIGFIKPDHPMFVEQKALAGAPELKFHEVEDIDKLCKGVAHELSLKDPVIIAKIYHLISSLSADSELLDRALAEYAPITQ